MDISLIQVGLSIITAFFVLAGYMVIYENPQQKELELNTITDRISSMIQYADGYWLEQDTVHQLTQFRIPVSITISPDFIRVDSKADSLSAMRSIPQNIWIVDEYIHLKTATSFHNQIHNETGQPGSREHPCLNKSKTLDVLDTIWLEQDRFHLDPFNLSNKDVISLEKCIIFIKENINGEQKTVPFFQFVIIQKI